MRPHFMVPHSLHGQMNPLTCSGVSPMILKTCSWMSRRKMRRLPPPTCHANAHVRKGEQKARDGQVAMWLHDTTPDDDAKRSTIANLQCKITGYRRHGMGIRPCGFMMQLREVIQSSGKLRRLPPPNCQTQGCENRSQALLGTPVRDGYGRTRLETVVRLLLRM